MTEQNSINEMDRVLDKVRALLRLADHPNTPEHEADLARRRADAMMLKYRIDEATAVSKGLHGDGEGGIKPVWLDVALGDIDSEFADHYSHIAGAVLRHVGAKGRLEYDYTTQTILMNTVGYESDLRYLDLLLTASLLEFGKRLEPKYDREHSAQWNAYEMRNAGMERKRISRILYGQWTTENEMKSFNRKVTRMIRAEAAERGEDADAVLGRGNNMKSYREDYADGFVSSLSTRLYRMRTAVGDESSGLVLADRAERVLEAYYDRFPDLRPKPAADGTDSRKDLRDGCEKCAKAKSGYCRAHAWLKPSTAQSGGRRWNGTAHERGRTAALMVDLGPNSTGTRRVGPRAAGSL